MVGIEGVFTNYEELSTMTLTLCFLGLPKTIPLVARTTTTSLSRAVNKLTTVQTAFNFAGLGEPGEAGNFKTAQSQDCQGCVEHNYYTATHMKFPCHCYYLAPQHIQLLL